MIIKRCLHKKHTIAIQDQIEMEKNEAIDFSDDNMINSFLLDYSSQIDREREELALENQIEAHLMSAIRIKKRNPIHLPFAFDFQALHIRPLYAIYSVGITFIIFLIFFDLNHSEEIKSSFSRTQCKINNRIATKLVERNGETRFYNRCNIAKKDQIYHENSPENIADYLLTVKDPSSLCADLTLNESDSFGKYTTIPNDVFN